VTLLLISEVNTEVQRFERKQSSTTIGRTEGDIRFPEDQFLSPLHTKLSWEDGRLEVRDQVGKLEQQHASDRKNGSLS